jgi:hypothetical protein
MILAYIDTHSTHWTLGSIHIKLQRWPPTSFSFLNTTHENMWFDVSLTLPKLRPYRPCVMQGKTLHGESLTKCNLQVR